jgi:protein SCO1
MAGRKTLLLSSVIVVAILVGIWAYMQRDSGAPRELVEEPTVQLGAARVYQVPRPIGPFHLQDQGGSAFDQERLKGAWSFLFFGYTHCPDLCPMTLLVLKEVREKLEQSGDRAGHALRSTQFVFVSVDPARDSLQDLKSYVSYFSPHFIGVTGSESALRSLASRLHIFYRQVERPGADGYMMEHSGSILLVDPQGRLYATFPAPHHASELAATYLDIRKREETAARGAAGGAGASG